MSPNEQVDYQSSDPLGGSDLGAGFAAQVIGPLLAVAAATVAALAPMRAMLNDSLGAALDAHNDLESFRNGPGKGVLSTTPRFIRWTSYLVGLLIDVGAGLVISHNMNIPDPEAWAVAASIALGMFYVPKTVGRALRRLDLTPRRSSDDDLPSGSSREHGRAWVSWLLIVAGVVMVLGVLGAFFASRQYSASVASYAATLQGQSPPPAQGTRDQLLTSFLIIGSAATTLYWSVRAFEDVSKLEQLEFRLTQRKWRLRWRLTKCRRPLRASGRATSLLQTGLAELWELVGSRNQVPEWQPIYNQAKELLSAHGKAIEFVTTTTMWMTDPARDTNRPAPDEPEDPPGDNSIEEATGPGQLISTSSNGQGPVR